MMKLLSTFYQSLIERIGLNRLIESLLMSLFITALFMDVKPRKGSLFKKVKTLWTFLKTLTLLCLVIFISHSKWTSKVE